LFTELTKKFNDYATKNNLNISLELTTFSQSNSTVKGGRETVQSLLENKSIKNDILYYGLTHLPEIEEHLVNLKPHYLFRHNKDVFFRII